MKRASPCLYEDADGPCGQSKNSSRHYGTFADHDYQGGRRPGFGSQRQPVNPRSKLPRRAERLQDGSEHAREHHARVRRCEAATHGITTPCRGRLEHSHRIGKGMGGGKDYAVSDGECDILCEAHHAEIDTRRTEMRAAGLSKPAPIPEKVTPRRIRKWD